MNSRTRPRVVITGVGAVTPLGLNVPDMWDALLAGRSGVTNITQFDASDLPCQIAAEVKNFDPAEYINFKEARRMARVSQLSVAAAQEALKDAGLSNPVSEPERTGVLVGTIAQTWRHRTIARRVSGLWVHLISSHLSPTCRPITSAVRLRPRGH